MEDFAEFLWDAAGRHTWIPPEMLLRLARAYGTRIDRVIDEAKDLSALGERFGGDFYESELRYMVDSEFARTAEDALWRRSRLGLHLPAAAQDRVEAWFHDRT